MSDSCAGRFSILRLVTFPLGDALLFFIDLQPLFSFLSQMGIVILKAFEILFLQIFRIQNAIICTLQRANDLIQFELDGFAVAILCALNKKDHQKCDNGGAGINNKLPGVAEVEERSTDGPDEHHDDCHHKGDGMTKHR